jgi:pilus assembly protein CpaB
VDRKALFIALGMAVLGGACLVLYMQRFETEVGGGPRVAVLVAARDIKLGEVLREPMLAVREIPQAYLDARHVRVADMGTVVGAPIRVAVKANELVMWSDLATTGADRRDLSSLVLPGMRALTIMGRRESLFGGLLRAGDRVDIAFSSTAMSGTGTLATGLLMQNVVVLAIGMDVGDGNRNSSAGTAITVSVTPEQAQRLIRARSEGQLDTVLRNPDDVVTLKDLPNVATATPPSGATPDREKEAPPTKRWRGRPAADAEAGDVGAHIDRIR